MLIPQRKLAAKGISLPVGEAGANFPHRCGDSVSFHCHLDQAHLVVVCLGIHLLLDLGLGDVEDREFQAYPAEHSRPGGIPFGQSQTKQFAALCGGSSDKDNDAGSPRNVYLPFDLFLTFQVKCTRRRSDETVGEFKDNFGACAFRTKRDGVALNTVSFSQHNDFLPIQLHNTPLTCVALRRPPLKTINHSKKILAPRRQGAKEQSAKRIASLWIWDH